MLEMLIRKLKRVFIHQQQCCNENEDCEEAVVEQIATKHQKIKKLVRMTQLSMME
jgi:hypothetical protein